MQTYTRITNEFTGVELPGKIDENLQSLKSHFSGTAFPTENLVVGMPCYRTDEKKVYRLMEDLATWKLESDLNYANGVPIATQSEAEKGEDDTKSMTPLKVKQSILRNVPTPETMTGASDTSDGLEGFVPAPKAGDNKKVLHGDGLWKKAIGFESYWEANEAVKVGDTRFPYGRENSGYILECVEAGTTGSTQPEIIETNEVANYADLGRVGQVRVIFNLAEKDVDEVMAMGITYSRLTYPELWEWAGKRAGLVISEEEWQAKFAETNGKFVPYYSSGDGSSTFRTPLLGAYLKGAETSSEVGKYVDAGLPNITGSLAVIGSENTYAGLTHVDGAFYGTDVQSSRSAQNAYSYLRSDMPLVARFNASRSSSVYGNSDTVTPETMNGVWVIKAVGVVVDSGETDIAQVLTATEQVQERVSAVEDNHKIKTFTSTLQIGIPDNNYTLTDIVNALPIDSQLIIRVSMGYQPNLDLPAYNCQLVITRTTYDFVEFLCSSPYTGANIGRFWRGVWFEHTTPQWSGWKQLATNGALSMPSGNAINIALTGTSTYYFAPADGWVRLGIEGATGVIQLANEDTNVNSMIGSNIRLDYFNIFIPVTKGNQVLIRADSANVKVAKFIYAQSEV